jgi:hypothetical protein
MTAQVATRARARAETAPPPGPAPKRTARRVRGNQYVLIGRDGAPDQVFRKGETVPADEATFEHPQWRDRRSLVNRRRPRLDPATRDRPAQSRQRHRCGHHTAGRAGAAGLQRCPPGTPLNLALSDDGCRWRHSRILDDGLGEFSYPAIIQGADERIRITYTWNRRRIRYASFVPSAP